MKNLKEMRQTTSFSAIAKMDNNQVLLKANVANDELSNGYSMTEIGVLARKKGTDDSILYCVVTAEESDYFPSASQGQYNIVFTIKTKIDDVENVSIVFSQEAYALAEELAVTNNSIQELEKRISSTEAIAKGKNRAKVFSTTESMNAWLSDSTNARVANVGDNLYIIDTGVPDWWISEVLTEPDEAGRYYKIAQLETQKVDLTTYDEKIAAINTELGKKVTTGSQAKLDMVGLGNSSTALVYSDEDNVNFRFKGENGDTQYTNIKK